MAVDTRNKRASILGLACAARLVLPAPDATVAQADRQHVAFCYAGIQADELNIVAASADVVVAVRSRARTVSVRARIRSVEVR